MYVRMPVGGMFAATHRLSLYLVERSVCQDEGAAAEAVRCADPSSCVTVRVDIHKS